MGTEKKFGIGGFLKETLGFGGVGAAAGGLIGGILGGIGGAAAGGVGAIPGALAGLKAGAAIGGTIGGAAGVSNATKIAITGKDFTPAKVAKNWVKKKMVAYSVAADKSDFDLFVQKIKAIAFELFMQLKKTLNGNSAEIAAVSKQSQAPSSGRGISGQQPAGQTQSQAKAQTPVQAQTNQVAKQQPVNSAQNIGNAALKNVAPAAAKAAAPIVGKGAALQNKSLTR